MTGANMALIQTAAERLGLKPTPDEAVAADAVGTQIEANAVGAALNPSALKWRENVATQQTLAEARLGGGQVPQTPPTSTTQGFGRTQ